MKGDYPSPQEIPIAGDSDVVRVRQATRNMAVSIGFSLVDQTKMVTAASELARNALVHGGGGLAILEIVVKGLKQGVQATFADTGPGIEDTGLALTDGYTTRGGLGLGLSGARRLVDGFELDTEVGKGTRVCVIKWKR